MHSLKANFTVMIIVRRTTADIGIYMYRSYIYEYLSIGGLGRKTSISQRGALFSVRNVSLAQFFASENFRYESLVTLIS